MRQQMYDKTPYVWSNKFMPVKKITQPLVVMVETFRMSGSAKHFTFPIKILDRCARSASGIFNV